MARSYAMWLCAAVKCAHAVCGVTHSLQFSIQSALLPGCKRDQRAHSWIIEVVERHSDPWPWPWTAVTGANKRWDAISQVIFCPSPPFFGRVSSGSGHGTKGQDLVSLEYTLALKARCGTTRPSKRNGAGVTLGRPDCRFVFRATQSRVVIKS